MIYLTYGEPPSGVFFSQVTDVLNYLEEKHQSKIRLVAFISLHDFSEKKNELLNHRHNSIVLPMLPKAPYWKFNAIILWLLCLFLKPKSIIARNVIAANMALRIKNKCSVKKVCFDGRGAMKAEWTEYPITVPDNWKNNIHELENNAVNKSDFRIAVTYKLVEHWQSALRNAPHTMGALLNENWDKPYSRESAAFPHGQNFNLARAGKYWPTVGRIDGAYGDRNLVCSCEPISELAIN